jgi:hypothetical protein
MVITQKMKETEMGYRGSKSEITELSTVKIISVKEQRVDGSWFLAQQARNLRCALMGGESRYQVKILSKQLNFKRNFSILVQISKLNP